MTPEQVAMCEAATAYAKQNKKPLARAIADKAHFPSEDYPVALFMAGSPGAGKTEVSKALSGFFNRPDQAHQGTILRIDPDEYRALIPGYTGENSWLVQAAVSIVVEKVFDLALDQKQSFILDGTFSNSKKSLSNIERCLGRGRMVSIYYVYQPAEQAWKFVQAREAVEGRNIPFDAFARQFIDAQNTVQLAKDTFKQDIDLTVLVKPIDSDDHMIHSDVNDLKTIIHTTPSLDQIYRACTKELI